MFEPLTALLPMLENAKPSLWTTCTENGEGMLEPGNAEHPSPLSAWHSCCPAAKKAWDAISSFGERHWELGLSTARGGYIGILERAGLWEHKENLNVAALDGRTVMAIVFSVIRAERFCDAAILGRLRDGSFARWIARLHEIDRAGEEIVALAPDSPASKLAAISQAILLGLACGDALGVPTEFKSRGSFTLDGMLGWGTHHQAPGTWSDDTSLALAFAMSLCPGGFDPETAGSNFRAWYYDNAFTPYGEVFDVGGTTAQAIVRMQTVASPELAGGKGERDNGNGSLMRIAPLVLPLLAVPDPAARWESVRKGSSLTHAHAISCACCFVFIEFLRLLARGLAKEEAYHQLCAGFAKGCGFIPDSVLHLLGRVLDGRLPRLGEKDIKSGGFVLHTLEAALWCLLTTESYAEAVLKAVNLGHDTDTTGAVAGAMAGLCYGEKAIPAEWRSELAKAKAIRCVARAAAKDCLAGG